ncbi:hypothetical protein HDV00_003110 [Rhizophlyctis rosea]|nr:hypothetical protein HDV00_003110 [Rhizophlyctis rosea]
MGKSRELSVVQTYALSVYGEAKFLGHLVDLMQQHMTDSQLAGDKSKYNQQLADLALGDGLQYFKCDTKDGKCPSAFDKKNPTTVHFSFKDSGSQGSFETLANQRLQITSHYIQYGGKVQYWGSGWCPSFTCCASQVPCLTDYYWYGLPQLNTDAATTNDYGSDAFGLYASSLQGYVNQNILNWVTHDARQFFSCSPGPCPTNYPTAHTAGMGKDDYTLTNIQVGELDAGCNPGAGSCIQNKYYFDGMPTPKTSWPKNPQQTFLDFISQAKTAVSSMVDLAKTSNDQNALAKGMEGLTQQLSIASEMLSQMTDYEKHVEDLVEQKRKQEQSVLGTILTLIIGVVVGALLPGIGEVLDGAIALFSAARGAIATSDAFSDFAAIFSRIGEWIGKAGRSIDEFLGGVFDALPAFMQRAITAAKNAFKKLGSVAMCGATQYADGEIQGAIIPDFADMGVPKRRSLPETIDQYPNVWNITRWHAPPEIGLEKRASSSSASTCLFQIKDRGDAELSSSVYTGFCKSNIAYFWLPNKPSPNKDPGADFPDPNDWSTHTVSPKLKTNGQVNGAATQRAWRSETDSAGFLKGVASANAFECASQISDHSFEASEFNQALGAFSFPGKGDQIDLQKLCDDWKNINPNHFGDNSGLLNDLKVILNGDSNMREITSSTNQLKTKFLGEDPSTPPGWKCLSDCDKTRNLNFAEAMGTLEWMGNDQFTTARTNTAKALSDKLNAAAGELEARTGLTADQQKTAKALATILRDRAENVVLKEKYWAWKARRDMRQPERLQETNKAGQVTKDLVPAGTTMESHFTADMKAVATADASFDQSKTGSKLTGASLEEFFKETGLAETYSKVTLTPPDGTGSGSGDGSHSGSGSGSGSGTGSGSGSDTNGNGKRPANEDIFGPLDKRPRVSGAGC